MHSTLRVDKSSRWNVLLKTGIPKTWIKSFKNTWIQWTLSISTTLYLELLSISNKKFGPLDICVLSKLFLSFYLELLYLEFFSISNKNPCPLRLFLPLSRTFSRLRVHLHSK